MSKVSINTIQRPVITNEPYDISTNSIFRYLMWPFYRLIFIYQDIRGVFPYSVVPWKINIGQEKDIEHGIKTFRELDDYKRIILYGRSRGCAVAIGVLANLSWVEVQRIEAIILEAPFDSVEHVLNTRFHWIFSGIIRILLRYLTLYRKDGVSPYQNVAKLPKDVPILIVSSKADKVIHPECTESLCKRMEECNLHIARIVLENSSHSGFAQDNIDDMIKYHDEVQNFYNRI